MNKLSWKDALEIRRSKNTRGEDTFDVYRKDTNEMLAADVLAGHIHHFLDGMEKFYNRIAAEELESILNQDIEGIISDTNKKDDI